MYLLIRKLFLNWKVAVSCLFLLLCHTFSFFFSFLFFFLFLFFSFFLFFFFLHFFFSSFYFSLHTNYRQAAVIKGYYCKVENKKKHLCLCLLQQTDRGKLTIAMKVSDAIAHIHSKRITHSDIKSDNILVGRFPKYIYILVEHFKANIAVFVEEILRFDDDKND